ncbi:MAG: glycosyltransferase family 39 protein [Dissulfurispiraceae bacterium]
MDLLYLDKRIFFLINRGITNPLLDGLMSFLSQRGYALLIPFALYLFWIAYKEDNKRSGFDISAVLRIAVVSTCAVLLSDWMGNEIKNAIMRVRPCNALEDVRLILGCTQSGSFPSNHAANSFAYALPLFYLTRNHLGLPARLYPFMLASLVALSRVYVGVHYPTDIVAGALLGTTVSLLLIVIYKFILRRYKTSPETTLLFAGLAAISVFRIYYILHGPLDLSPDEAHYWEWSRRLDLSYYSKGPMIAYLIYLGTHLFGNTVFGIRVLAIIFSAVSSIYIFKLVNIMYGNDYLDHNSMTPQRSARQRSAALQAAFAFQAIPLFSAFGVLFTIDSPFTFFWIVSLYIFYKAISEGSKRQWMTWIFLGLALGFGMLTKYTMAFFTLCGLLLLLFSDKRSLLKTPMPYIAFVVSMLVFSPVIIWNAQHDWMTLRHTAGQAHIADGFTLTLKSFFEFLGSQIGIITPLFFCLIIYALFKLFFSDRAFQSKFLFYFSIPVLSFFLLKALQGKVEANWAMFGYITGIIAAARFSINDHSHTRRVFFSICIGFALLLTVISHYPSIVRLPQNLDPSARLRGWKELGIEVSKLSEQTPNRSVYLLFSDSYQMASELAFYVQGNPETFSINLGRRMDQYDLWPDINDRAAELRRQTGPQAVGAVNGIFVQSGNRDMPPVVARAFDHYSKNLFSVYEHGRILRQYSIFICYNFKNLKIPKPETF